MNLKLLSLAGLLVLGGCASPWVSYQEALRCHLDDKGPECNAKYKKAIKANTKMPGIHSSYGTHLLLQGNKDEAEKEFKLEQENYPGESSKSIAALLNPSSVAPQAPAPTPEPAPEPVAAPPAPAAPVNSTPAPATKSTKSTKKDANRAK